MLRLAGALLLAMGPAVIGFRAADCLRRRPRRLRETAGALEQMEREISYRLTPLPELFSTLSQEYSGPVGELFARCARDMDGLGQRSMAQIWRQALSDAALDIEGRGLRALEELGEVLGRYDGKAVRGALKRACAELYMAADEAEREWERKGRMDQVLGLTAGALLVILLI